MGNHRRANFSEEADQYIVDNFKYMTARELADDLHCSIGQMQVRIRKLKDEGRITGNNLKSNKRPEKPSVEIDKYNISICKGDSCRIISTNKGGTANRDKLGEVVYKDNKLVVIRTKNYNVSYALVDVLMGDVIIERVM